MKFRLVVLLLLTVAPSVIEAETQASVKVVVSDNFGNRINGADIKLMRDGQVTPVREDSLISLPFGAYILSVSVPGAVSERESITIEQPRQVIAVAMKLGAMEGAKSTCAMRGNVSGAQGMLRLRLMAVFSSYSVDVGVLDTGAYSFTGLECGEYILIAFGSKGCIGAQHRKLAGGDSIVDLKFDSSADNNGCPLPR